MTTALYRRYRPEAFEDVIGQEHVTEPLMTALRKDRVSHAYLFSGPRGCGKTTSARILARCLNCAAGPTATPCGRCESCRDLARDGAGSLDVIEMDAASHGGVDHARDLRERATFAPVRDRFKIFIIDEAHMVTREGFNALLKIVEEPPEHIKFIFATTEPSKVLTTIRSRTHHYPFRLVPPEPLVHYLEQLCAEERVPVAPGVLSLVVRAGGGSVRDTLSVLDQLMAGSEEEGIGYDLAVALLGYTHGALLDDVVDAFASGDAATVFRAVDRVVQTGQDPRRFVEDLLQRFRDLVIVNAVPESAGNILHGMPQDQVSRLRNQASQLGAAELSRAADITNTALTEMTGATSPQLHLELLCARILLPSSEDTTRGVTARVDRLERRLSITRGTAPVGATGQAGRSGQAQRPSAPTPQPSAAPADREPARAEPPAASPAVAPDPAPQGPAPGGAGRDADPEGAPAPDGQRPPEARPPGGTHAAAAAEQVPPANPPAVGTGDEIDLLRASWPEIVNALADIRRVAWFTVQRGTPQSFDGQVLRIMFDAEGDLMNFPRFEDDLRQAVQQVLGIDCRAEAVPPGGGHARGGGGTPSGPEPSAHPDGNRSGPGTRTPGPQEPATRVGGQRPPARPDGQHGGRDAREARGTRDDRPSADEAPQRNDPARDEEPVHSWAVAAIPRGGDPERRPDRTADGAPAGDRPGTAGAPLRPATPPAPGRSPDPPAPGGSADSWNATSTPAHPAAPAGTGRSAAAGRSADRMDPAAGATGRWDPDASAPLDRDVPPAEDDVPPPEEPPYPEDLDETPPEQWRPEPPVRRDPAPPVGPGTPQRAPGPSAAAPTVSRPAAGAPGAAPPDGSANAARRERLSFRERHAAAIAAGRQGAAPAAAPDGGVEWDDSFVPGSDDEALEDSTLYGRAAIERILGGTLVEEREIPPGE